MNAPLPIARWYYLPPRARAGTRVPVETLVDYLQGGYRMGEFLDNFPSVTPDQAHAALELMRQALLGH